MYGAIAIIAIVLIIALAIQLSKVDWKEQCSDLLELIRGIRIL